MKQGKTEANENYLERFKTNIMTITIKWQKCLLLKRDHDD